MAAHSSSDPELGAARPDAAVNSNSGQVSFEASPFVRPGLEVDQLADLATRIWVAHQALNAAPWHVVAAPAAQGSQTANALWGVCFATPRQSNEPSESRCCRIWRYRAKVHCLTCKHAAVDMQSVRGWHA